MPHQEAPRLLAGDRELHLHFHGVTAEDVAAILADVNHDGYGRVDSEMP